MKKIAILLILPILVLISCNKPDDLPEPQSVPNITITTSSVIITDSMYLGSWYATNLLGNYYQNIGSYNGNPYTYNYFDDCNTESNGNSPQILEFRGDTMIFTTVTGYEWLYTHGTDTLWSGAGNTINGTYFKCIQ